MDPRAARGAVSAETLAFQLVMPTLDEELVFRGILLVLFTAATRPAERWYASAIGSAAVWTTALLFGLAHVSLSRGLDLDVPTFARTFALGLILAWMTRRSGGSLWPAAIVHSVTNAVPALLLMIA